MRATILAAIIAALNTPAFAAGHASGDAAAGEKVFNQCQTCHVVQDIDGNTLAGRNAKTGPNLYGLPGRIVGSVDGFRYGDSIVEVGEAGTAWDEASFVAYVQNPKAWLEEELGGRARSKMAFRLRSEEDAADVWAYIASLSPEPES
ncbi:MAG: c-type cytochrome [Pseudomonadota bacterium]